MAIPHDKQVLQTLDLEQEPKDVLVALQNGSISSDQLESYLVVNAENIDSSILLNLIDAYKLKFNELSQEKSKSSTSSSFQDLVNKAKEVRAKLKVKATGMITMPAIFKKNAAIILAWNGIDLKKFEFGHATQQQKNILLTLIKDKELQWSELPESIRNDGDFLMQIFHETNDSEIFAYARIETIMDLLERSDNKLKYEELPNIDRLVIPGCVEPIGIKHYMKTQVKDISDILTLLHKGYLQLNDIPQQFYEPIRNLFLLGKLKCERSALPEALQHDAEIILKEYQIDSKKLPNSYIEAMQNQSKLKTDEDIALAAFSINKTVWEHIDPVTLIQLIKNEKINLFKLRQHDLSGSPKEISVSNKIKEGIGGLRKRASPEKAPTSSSFEIAKPDEKKEPRPLPERLSQYPEIVLAWNGFDLNHTDLSQLTDAQKIDPKIILSIYQVNDEALSQLENIPDAWPATLTLIRSGDINWEKLPEKLQNNVNFVNYVVSNGGEKLLDKISFNVIKQLIHENKLAYEKIPTSIRNSEVFKKFIIDKKNTPLDSAEVVHLLNAGLMTAAEVPEQFCANEDIILAVAKKEELKNLNPNANEKIKAMYLSGKLKCIGTQLPVQVQEDEKVTIIASLYEDNTSIDFSNLLPSYAKNVAAKANPKTSYKIYQLNDMAWTVMENHIVADLCKESKIDLSKIRLQVEQSGDEALKKKFLEICKEVALYGQSLTVNEKNKGDSNLAYACLLEGRLTNRFDPKAFVPLYLGGSASTQEMLAKANLSEDHHLYLAKTWKLDFDNKNSITNAIQSALTDEKNNPGLIQYLLDKKLLQQDDINGLEQQEMFKLIGLYEASKNRDLAIENMLYKMAYGIDLNQVDVNNPKAYESEVLYKLWSQNKLGELDFSTKEQIFPIIELCLNRPIPFNDSKLSDKIKNNPYFKCAKNTGINFAKELVDSFKDSSLLTKVRYFNGNYVEAIKALSDIEGGKYLDTISLPLSDIKTIMTASNIFNQIKDKLPAACFTNEFLSAAIDTKDKDIIHFAISKFDEQSLTKFFIETGKKLQDIYPDDYLEKIRDISELPNVIQNIIQKDINLTPSQIKTSRSIEASKSDKDTKIKNALYKLQFALSKYENASAQKRDEIKNSLEENFKELCRVVCQRRFLPILGDHQFAWARPESEKRLIEQLLKPDSNISKVLNLPRDKDKLAKQIEEYAKEMRKTPIKPSPTPPLPSEQPKARSFGGGGNGT